MYQALETAQLIARLACWQVFGCRKGISTRKGNTMSDHPEAMMLSDYTISDATTFKAVTAAGHEIAGLYAYAGLDMLVDLARCVSLNFFLRSEILPKETVLDRWNFLGARQVERGPSWPPLHWQTMDIGGLHPNTGILPILCHASHVLG
jgi:hypothetical protein